jgi:NADP+-dependent farnesol dehydrogenase
MEENNMVGKFYPLECDLTNENDILKAFKWIDDNLSGIHFLINNAGIVRISSIMGKNCDILKTKTTI